MAAAVYKALTKAQRDRLAAMSPEDQAKVKRYLYLTRRLEKDKQINPVGWFKPLSHQERFLRSTARQRLVTGGNRSGKTEIGVVELLYWLLGKSPYRPIPAGPLTLVVSSESFEVQKHTIIDKIGDLCPRNSSFALVYNREDKYLQGPNGTALFKSAEQGWRAYQGLALDAFWMDEEQDYEIYKQLSKRLKRDSVIQSWFTMTPEPDKSDHWTYDALAVPAMEGSEGIERFEFDLDDNRKSRGGFIDDSEIDALIALTPVEDRDAVIHGKYVKRGGLMYPMWSRQHHVVSSVPLKSFLDGVKGGTYTAFCSLDWGVRNPTAILLFVEDKDENVDLIDEIYHPAESVDQIKREYKQRFATFSPVFVYADPSIWNNHDTTDPERTIAGQLTRDLPGLPALPLEKADNDVTNGLAAVRELLSVHPSKGPKLRVQDRCTNFIREMENYVGDEYVNTPYLRNKKETPRKQNDHAMDALRYFALSPHKWIAPRHQRRVVPFRVNPVTGYVRPGV